MSIDLSSWNTSDEVYVSVKTISELLMGVHRATTEQRKQRRMGFVEAVISGVQILDFTITSARQHARLYAELAKNGTMIGAHDLMIAATAVDRELSLRTDNVDEFKRVPGLRVIPFISNR